MQSALRHRSVVFIFDPVDYVCIYSNLLCNWLLYFLLLFLNRILECVQQTPPSFSLKADQ